jgi:hypothetical protein
MTERAGNSTEVRPLTKRKKETQALYARRPDAELQIGKVLPLDAREIFELLGASEKSFVISGVINAASFGGVLKKAIGVPDSTLSYPGSVKMVELISRTLENKDNKVVLK